MAGVVSNSAHPGTPPAPVAKSVRLEAPVLLYDGGCGLCAASVQFILRHERRHTLRFAALQSRFAEDVRVRHPELTGIDSMAWVEPAGEDGERVFVRSAAAIRAARYLGGPWHIATLALAMPRSGRDAAYNLVARHRHYLFGGSETCYAPPASARARFLD